MKKFEEQVLKIIKKYQKILLLQRFTFMLVYDPKLEENSIMESAVVYPYLNAKISYGKTALEYWREGRDMKPYIIHEMCHSLTDPLYIKAIQRYTTSNEINDERETLTDLISHIIIKNDL